jgi:hypothetical protein
VLYPAYVLVLVLGLRKGELLGLTWELVSDTLAGLSASRVAKARWSGNERIFLAYRDKWATLLEVGPSAIAVFGQPLSPGETTDAGPLWLFDNFSEVKEMGPCSPPFMAEIARALGERYEPA